MKIEPIGFLIPFVLLRSCPSLVVLSFVFLLQTLPPDLALALLLPIVSHTTPIVLKSFSRHLHLPSI